MIVVMMMMTMTMIRPECCPLAWLLPTGNDKDYDLNDNEDDDGDSNDYDVNDQTRVLPRCLPLAHW